MPTAESKAPVQKQKSTKVDNKIANAVAKVEQGSSGVSEQQKTSQGATTGNKTPQEQPEFIKQSLIIIEKKVRNLEKRRSKLDEYKASKTPLNEDQLLAVSKYEEVVRTLELARELEKQFISLSNDAMKQQKRQAKKEQLEREEIIKERLKEAHKINSLLETFGDENVRNNFMTESSGAIKLTEQELSMLDEFHKLIEPSEIGDNLEKSSTEAADHMLFTIEGRNKPITSFNQESTGQQVTYNDLKKLFEKILTCNYWNQEIQQPEQVQEELVEPVQSEEQNLINEVQTLNLNEQVQNEQEQQMYQNTSDEYVLVNSTDYNSENTQNAQQQQPQSKAFFSTLNPSTNINEFLQSNNEGINFLQDSEIQQEEQIHEPQLQDPEQVHAKNQSQSLGSFQNEGQREYRGGRGGHREYNGNRNYDQRRNYEQRRSGGGNFQLRGDRAERSDRGERGERGERGDNGPRNGNGGGGGYRGGRGAFRGGFSNSGQRSGSGGNQYSRQQREQPVAHH